jgi:hypothetical protein
MSHFEREIGDLLRDLEESLRDQFAIRMDCWQTTGQWPSSGIAGTVVRAPIYFAGQRRLGMLMNGFEMNRAVQVITDNRCGMCARHEITIPRTPLLPFLPHRLRLSYGVWTEPGGARVLFSRDYAPMWRLRDGLRRAIVARSCRAYRVCCGNVVRYVTDVRLVADVTPFSPNRNSAVTRVW